MSTAGEAGTAAGSGAGRGVLLVAAAVGALVGLLGREVPVFLVLRAGVGTRETRSCGMEEAAECAFELLPTALGAMLAVAVALVVACGALALVGGALLVVGVVRHRRAARAWPSAVLVAAGTALLMPALSLVVSIVRALAS